MAAALDLTLASTTSVTPSMLVDSIKETYHFTEVTVCFNPGTDKIKYTLVHFLF
jgi:hypothetical protein